MRATDSGQMPHGGTAHPLMILTVMINGRMTMIIPTHPLTGGEELVGGVVGLAEEEVELLEGVDMGGEVILPVILPVTTVHLMEDKEDEDEAGSTPGGG